MVKKCKGHNKNIFLCTMDEEETKNKPVVGLSHHMHKLYTLWLCVNNADCWFVCIEGFK